jgi:hypothetical protein
VAGGMPAVVDDVPAVGLVEPPVVLEPAVPFPALEIEPAEPVSGGAVASEQATANAAPAPN